MLQCFFRKEVVICVKESQMGRGDQGFPGSVAKQKLYAHSAKKGEMK